MSSQPDSSTANQNDVPSKVNDSKTATPKDGEKLNSRLNSGVDDKNPSSNRPVGAANAALSKSTTELKDSDKKASLNANNNTSKSTVTNSTFKRVPQSTNAERATDSDNLSNPIPANVASYAGDNSSSLTAPRSYSNYGGSNSHRGPRRPMGQSTNFQNNSDGHMGSSVENLSKTNLYIRGLAPTTTDEDLYNMCSKFGNILSTKAIQDKASCSCKGYGFVLFATPQAAEIAVAELTKTGIQAQMARAPNHHETQNKHSSYQNNNHNHHHHHHNNNNNNNSHYHHNQYPHNNQLQNHGNNSHSAGSSNMVNNHSHNDANHPNIADPTNLYLANLPTNMGEAELEELLSSFGPVVSTRILRDEGFNPRGVGFARMESRDKCQEIIEKLNGKPYKGSREPLLVKFADGGNRKRHHNNHHHHQHQHHHNNSHHKLGHDDSRWREGGEATDQSISQPNYEHQRNMPHGNHLTDMSLMGPMGYPRIQPTFPPAIPTNAPYPPNLGPSTSTAQWIHPGSGQAWNVIPQMIPPNNLGPSNQAAVPPNYPYGHIPQLANQMQGLQISHHSGGPMSGYMPQWSPVWPHHMPPPQQTSSQSVRPAGPMQSSPTSQQQPQQQQQSQHQHQQQQQIPLVLTGATQTFTEVQDIPQAVSSKQLNSSDTGRTKDKPPSW